MGLVDDFIASRSDHSEQQIVHLLDQRVSGAGGEDFTDRYPECQQFLDAWETHKGTLTALCEKLKIPDHIAIGFISDTLAYYDKLTGDDVVAMMRPLIVKAEAIRAMSDSDVAAKFMQMYGYYPVPKSATIIGSLTQQNVQINEAPSFADEMDMLRKAGKVPMQLEATTAVALDDLGVSTDEQLEAIESPRTEVPNERPDHAAELSEL